jgi:PIN domain nuclease of toxin-antitoxin system
VSVAVLDASALLALVQDEPGAERVEDALARGAVMSAVNWAETLSRLAECGVAPESAAGRLHVGTSGDAALEIAPFDAAQARDVARLRQPTRHLKLSLGDRACLALGRATGLPVLTTDRAWREAGKRLKVRVEVIRL